MDTFKETIAKIIDSKFPANLHGFIMRKIFFLKYRNYFVLIPIVLLGNFLFSAYSLWAKIIEIDLINFSQTMLDGVWSDFDLLMISLSMIAQEVPYYELSFCLFSLALLSISCIVFYHYNKRQSLMN